MSSSMCCCMIMARPHRMLLFLLAACGPTARGSLANNHATVAAQNPIVTSLRLDPREVALAPREQFQFQIRVKWSDGATIVPALRWTLEGGEVSSRGLYTAAATAGDYRIIVALEAGSLADTTVVSVRQGSAPARPSPAPQPPTAQPPPAPISPRKLPWPSNEPAGYTPIVGRSFNSLGATGPKGYGTGRGAGSPPYMVGLSEGWDDIERRYRNVTLSVDPAAPLSPPNVLRLLYPPQGPIKGTYSPGVVQTMGFTATQNYYGEARHYRKLYFRTAFRVSANWQGHSSNTNKMFFVRATRGFEPIIRLRGSGSGTLVLNVDPQGSEGPGGDPRAATGGFNPNTAGATAAGAWSIQRGRWYVLEGVLGIGSDGATNGVLKLWLDGVLTHDYADVEYQKAAARGEITWGYLHIAPTWGGGGGTIRQLMWMDFDDFYVSGAP